MTMTANMKDAYIVRSLGLLLITLYWSFMPLTISHLLCALAGSAGYVAFAALRPSFSKAEKKVEEAFKEEEEEEALLEWPSESGPQEADQCDQSSEEETDITAEEAEIDEAQEKSKEDSDGAEPESGEELAAEALQRAAAPFHARVLSQAARPTAAFPARRPQPPAEDPPPPPMWLLTKAPVPVAPKVPARQAAAVPGDWPEVRRLEEEVRNAKQFQSQLEAGETLDSNQMGKVLQRGKLERLLALRHAEQVVAQIGGVLLVSNLEQADDKELVNMDSLQEADSRGCGGPAEARGRGAVASRTPPSPPFADEDTLKDLLSHNDCCWDWAKTGRCPRGTRCSWRHPPLAGTLLESA